MKQLIVIFLLFLSVQSFGQKKQALIIANSNYNFEKTGWGKINADADIKYVVDALKMQGFSEAGITIIKDADKSAIIASLHEFKNKLKPGYSAVIHYSGHGQQVTDKESEEIDGLDEAWVPIDAPSSLHYGGENYQGEKHLTDDELGAILKEIRKFLGTEGHLVMLMDACHSGTGSRGGNNVARGTSAPYIWKELQNTHRGVSDNKFMDEDDDAIAKFVLFSGASAHQLNYETKDDFGKSVGSLSYAFAKACSDLKEDFTYRQLFASIQSVMAIKASNQDPLVEGDIDYKIFNGEIVVQTPYYMLDKKLSDKMYELNGGFLNGLSENSTVGLFPKGTTDPFEQKDKLIAKGVVKNAGAVGSTVEFETPVEAKNLKDYFIFLLEKNLDASKIKIKVDNKSRGASSLVNLQKDLETKKIFEFTDGADANILLKEDKGQVYIITNDTTWTCSGMSSCSNKLEVYAQGTFLKELSFNDPKYQVDLRFIPVRVQGSGYDRKVLDTLDILEFTTPSGLAFPVGTMFMLEVENTGTRDAHFAILDIQPDGVINAVLPYGQDILPQDCFLKRGQKTIIPGTYFEIFPPYGLETYKILAAKDPINTEPIITKKDTRGPGALSDLELLIKDTYGTRGTQNSSFSSSSNTGSCKNVHFKIVH